MSAYAYDESLMVEPVSKYDFVPKVSIDRDYQTEEDKKKYEIIDTQKKCSLSKCLTDSQPILSRINFDKKECEKEIILRFNVSQGNPQAKDPDGTIEAKGIGVKILSRTKLEVKYGWKILFKISTENIENDARIEFYSQDSGFWDKQGGVTGEILCGVLNFGYKKTCFCNRGFTEADMTNIITQIRKQDGKRQVAPRDAKGNKQYIDKTGKIIPSTDRGKRPPEAVETYTIEKNMFDDIGTNIFDLNYAEQIKRKEANIKNFTDKINATLTKYEINTCIRKIHFLAQSYVETQNFRLTYEVNPNNNVSGGSFYRGRGIIQLTHDYNYKKYYESLKNKIPSSEELNEFVPEIAKTMNLAVDVGGYYWKNIGAFKGNISQFADKDDVVTVTKEINGYKAKAETITERTRYTNLLKDILGYENCIKNNEK